MMKLKKKILLFSIICIGGIVFYFACKYAYDFKVSELKEKAQDTFREAFNQYLKSRNHKDLHIVIFNKESALDANVPDSVSMEDESGKSWYPLDPQKSSMNITTNTMERFSHSIAFKEKPFVPDSLNSIWNKQLQEAEISFKSALCLSLTNENDSIVWREQSCQSEWCNSSNSVFTLYIGYACEIEAIGYLHYSVWGMIYEEIILYLFLYIIVVCGLYRAFVILRCKIHSLRSREIVEIIKEVPIEVEVIKEVQKMDPAIRSYKLKENMIFYAGEKCIELDGVTTRLQPQASRLLELFLDHAEKEYVLKYDEIMEVLWPDETNYSIERVHKAIDRLRCVFQKLDPSIHISRGTGTYQLLIQ